MLSESSGVGLCHFKFAHQRKIFAERHRSHLLLLRAGSSVPRPPALLTKTTREYDWLRFRRHLVYKRRSCHPTPPNAGPLKTQSAACAWLLPRCRRRRHTMPHEAARQRGSSAGSQIYRKVIKRSGFSHISTASWRERPGRRRLIALTWRFRPRAAGSGSERRNDFRNTAEAAADRWAKCELC